MLTHIHPSRHPFTCRIRPIFNGRSIPAQSPGPSKTRQAPRAPLLARGVTSYDGASRTPSEGTTPPSSLLRAHASDQIPPRGFDSLFHGVFAGCRQSLLQDGPSRRYLCASFPRCLDPYRGGVPDASTHYFSGTIGLPPVPMGRLPATIHSATSEGG
jgi:hypothetical protein